MATVNTTQRQIGAAGRRADVYGMAMGYEAADPWNRTGATATAPSRQHYHEANAGHRHILPTWAKVALIVCCIGAAGAVAGPAKAATVGVHVGSWHSNPGYNNVNPGVMARADSGLTAGAYCNSESRSERFPTAPRCQLAAYAGYHRDWDLAPGLKVGLTGGVLTGYSRAQVLPFVVPSLLIGDHVRLIYAPKVEPKGVQTVSLVLEF